MLVKHYDQNIEPVSTISFTKAQLYLNYIYIPSEPHNKFATWQHF